MEVLLIILGVLMVAVLVLSVWGYNLLSRKIDYVYGNQEILYSKMLETQITVTCMYLKDLGQAYRHAVKNEQFEDAKMLDDTLKTNYRTLSQLKEEYGVIQKKRMEPR